MCLTGAKKKEEKRATIAEGKERSTPLKTCKQRGREKRKVFFFCTYMCERVRTEEEEELEKSAEEKHSKGTATSRFVDSLSFTFDSHGGFRW